MQRGYVMKCADCKKDRNHGNHHKRYEDNIVIHDVILCDDCHVKNYLLGQLVSLKEQEPEMYDHILSKVEFVASVRRRDHTSEETQREH